MKAIKVIYRKLGKEKAWGQAHSHNNSVELDPRITGKKHLEILTHESLHILFPELSNVSEIRLLNI